MGGPPARRLIHTVRRKFPADRASGVFVSAAPRTVCDEQQDDGDERSEQAHQPRSRDESLQRANT
jgi:hypothetical protein